MSEAEAEFKEATRFLTSPAAKTLKVDTKTKLKLYALYKQSTAGPNTTPKPSSFNITDSAKWKAWTALAKMSKDDARNEYLALYKQVRASATRSKL